MNNNELPNLDASTLDTVSGGGLKDIWNKAKAVGKEVVHEVKDQLSKPHPGGLGQPFGTGLIK